MVPLGVFLVLNVRLSDSLFSFLPVHLVWPAFLLGKLRRNESAYSVTGCVISPPSLLPTFSELALILIKFELDMTKAECA